MNTPENSPFWSAVQAQGGAAAVAERLSLHWRTLYWWKDGRVPAERVATVSRALGVPKHVLRPDLHDPPGVCNDNANDPADPQVSCDNPQVSEQAAVS